MQLEFCSDRQRTLNPSTSVLEPALWTVLQLISFNTYSHMELCLLISKAFDQQESSDAIAVFWAVPSLYLRTFFSWYHLVLRKCYVFPHYLTDRLFDFWIVFSSQAKLPSQHINYCCIFFKLDTLVNK